MSTAGLATCSGPKGCGRQWKGANQCHCRVCHHHFGTVNAFDAHRPNATGCPHPATLSKGDAPVLRLESGPLGDTWVGARTNTYWKADT